MITTTISSQNQITLPKFILKILGLSSGDKLLLQVEEKMLVAKPAGKSIIETLAGSLNVSASKRGLPFKKVRAETEELAAKEIVK